MHVERVTDKSGATLRDLLLLADEQWSCVERYLERAEVYALVNDENRIVAEIALTGEGSDVAEVQNLAVTPDFQRRGFGQRLLDYALRRCRGRFGRLRVRTGDSPLTVPFYERCGFAQVGREEGAILARYDHPIFEAGRQLTDVVILERDVPAFRHATRVFTSDLHIGDRAIARWRGFGDDVCAHDELVLGRLEQGLRHDDELWILGDVCRPRVEDVRRLRAAIPCERVNVIVGNHDTKAKFVTAGGFGIVEYYAHVGKVRRDGYRFVMSHYPMLDWDRAYHGSYMLHGHIHSLAKGASQRKGVIGLPGYNDMMREQGTRRYDVGLDANGMAPVTAEQIVAALPSDEEWSSLHNLPVD